MPRGKLTVAQKYEIYDRYMTGETTYKALAEEYGLNVQGVGHIIRRIITGAKITGTDRIWKRVGPEDIICPKLEQWRQEHKMTQEELAKACGVSRPTIRAILYRHDKERRPYGPRQNVLCAVSRVTGIAVDDLIYRTEAEKDDA